LFSSFRCEILTTADSVVVFGALLIIILPPTHKINNTQNSKQIKNIQNQIFAMSQQVVDKWWPKNKNYYSEPVFKSAWRGRGVMFWRLSCHWFLVWKIDGKVSTHFS
jgi:hypothetical protein